MLDEKGWFVNSDYLKSDQDIADFVAKEAHTSGNVIVIDAPLICVNNTGQRPCETLVGKCYGRFDASCHSSNTSNLAGQRGQLLVNRLRVSLPIIVQHDARHISKNEWPVVETYPHPGHIELFGLSRILKYKKGRVDAKREGLRQYVTHLHTLGDRIPPLQIETVPFLYRDISTLKGNALKKQEDLLDALFCAYTALHLWRYREDPSRWRVIRENNCPDFITIPLRK